MKDFPSGGYVPFTTMRGRDKDGNRVNIYAHPDAQPDPNIYLVEGPAGYGFNLDGKVTDEDFTNPETGERGIDNQLWRAVGCTHNYHISLPEIPLYPFAQGEWTFEHSTGIYLLGMYNALKRSADYDPIRKLGKSQDFRNMLVRCRSRLCDQPGRRRAAVAAHAAKV